MGKEQQKEPCEETCQKQLQPVTAIWEIRMMGWIRMMAWQVESRLDSEGICKWI